MDHYKYFKEEYNKRNLELELGERPFDDRDSEEEKEETKKLKNFHSDEKKQLDLPEICKKRPSSSADRPSSNRNSTFLNIMKCLSLCSRERMERLRAYDKAPGMIKEGSVDLLSSTPSKASYSFLSQSYCFSPALKNITNVVQEGNKESHDLEPNNNELLQRKVSYEARFLEDRMSADIIKEYFRRVNEDKAKTKDETDVNKKDRCLTSNLPRPAASNFIELCNFRSRNSLDQTLLAGNTNQFNIEPRILVFKPIKTQEEIIGFEEKPNFDPKNRCNIKNEDSQFSMDQLPINEVAQRKPNETEINENPLEILEPASEGIEIEGGACLDNDKLNPLDALVNEVMRSPSFFYQIKNVTHSQENSENDIKKWKEEILPDLKSGLNRSKVLIRVKKMALKKSIPSEIRGKVWLQLVGNKCQINKKYFRLLEKKLLEQPLDQKTERIIVFDIKRTYPNLSILSPGSELNQQLTQLLSLFHIHRSDIGYVQGMAYPALIILYHLETYEAFKCFTNLILGNDFILLLYRFKLKTLQAYFRTFEFFLNRFHPKLFQHLQDLQISSEIYLIEWLFTLLSRAYEIGLVIKIWDLFLIEGEIVFFQNFLAIFKMMEKELLKCNGEDILSTLKDGTANLDQNTLFKYTVNSKLNVEDFSKILLIEKKKSI